MLLNRVEKHLMNNPVRAAIQRYVEAPLLLRLGGPLRGGRVLEIGCGRGVGTQIILEKFGVDTVDAIDLDPDMVSRATQRLQRHGDRVRVAVGDAARIDAKDASYDAVFDFGIIHHIPEWRVAIDEVFRVLRPGGRFYAEEVLADALDHRLMRLLLVHPSEDRFGSSAFRRQLGKAGFELVNELVVLDHVAWFVARRPVD